MHSYSIDSDERRNITILVAFLGIGAAWVLNRVLDASGLSIPWWLDAPAAFGFATFFYTLFERWLWRVGIFRYVGLVAAPDISGRWVGRVVSSHEGHEKDVEITMRIRQTWTRITVTLRSETSRSYSINAGISAPTGDAPELTHTYLNEPLAGSVDSMNIHYGTATMRLRDHGVLEGEYYTGRGRETYGSIRVQRQ